VLAGLVISVACVAVAIYSSRIDQRDSAAWWLLTVALGLGLLWSMVVGQWGSPPPEGVSTLNWRRGIPGGLLAASGTALFAWAPYVLLQEWEANFDRAWLAWLTGAIALSAGLELLWGRSDESRSPKSQRRFLWSLVALLAIATLYRFFRLGWFPGEGHITQIEELQNGLFGQMYLDGGRWRWEYLSETWLSALAIQLRGPTLNAVREALAVVSTLKVIPVFLWLSYTVGNLGAVIGTALLACSSWDVTFSRIGQPTQILPAVTFALLAGPVRRGRPGAFVWLGFLGGFLLYAYIAFRPLILFILAGATVFSLRDAGTRWPLRLTRVLLVVAIIVSMGLPLFLNRLSGRIHLEYFDGLNRARGYNDYYNSNDTWPQALEKRFHRAAGATELFFFHGDLNVTHNIEDRPLVDPVTATLMLLGVAYCLTHLRSGVFGLTLVGFALGIAGTLVVTGNWDLGRVATNMVYPYVLAGYGAAVVASVLGGAWPRGGRRLAIALLAAATLAAFYLNTTFLFRFWNAPEVRRAMHHNLATLSSWLRQNVRLGERAVVISPEVPHVLMPNDGYWLLGGKIPGMATPELAPALQALADHAAPTLLVVYAGSSTAAVRDYLQWLIPGVELQFEGDPEDRGGEIAYAHLPGPCPELRDRIEAARCRGAAVEYTVHDVSGGTLAQVTRIAPFVDVTTWPAEIDRALERFAQQASHVRVRFQAPLDLATAGAYVFMPQAFSGEVRVAIDGRETDARTVVQLDAASHSLSFEARSPAIRPGMPRLLWRNPQSAEPADLVPLYRLVAPQDACVQAKDAAAG